MVVLKHLRGIRVNYSALTQLHYLQCWRLAVEYNMYLRAERRWEIISLALGKLMFSILHVFLQAATISIFIKCDSPAFQGFR